MKSSALISARGFESIFIFFSLAIKCKDRAYDLNKDRISLTFEFGQNPSMVKGTKAVTEMLQKRDFSMNDTWETLFDRRLGQRKN